MGQSAFDKALGKLLRAKREARGLTLEQVGNALGFTKMAVSNWETGKRSMYAAVLKNYCELLGVSVQSIFDEIEGI